MSEDIEISIQNPVIQTPKTNWLFFLLVGIIILVVGIGIGLFLGKQIYSPNTVQINSYDQCVVAEDSYLQESNPPTCVTANGLSFKGPVSSPTPTPGSTANWKTYTNNYENYEIKYPSNFSRMVCPNEETQLYLVQDGGGEDPIVSPTCGRDSRYQIEVISSTKPITINDNRYNISTETTSIDGIQAKKYTSTQKPSFEGPGESWYVDVIITKDGKYYDIYTRNKDSLTTFDQILFTFKFLDQNSDPEGKFCGGIAGNLSENQCPVGYTCKLDGKYPDASGKCIPLR